MRNIPVTLRAYLRAVGMFTFFLYPAKRRMVKAGVFIAN